ncbi:unnamed protein product, partial [Ostreobium quekettii]
QRRPQGPIPRFLLLGSRLDSFRKEPSKLRPSETCRRALRPPEGHPSRAAHNTNNSQGQVRNLMEGEFKRRGTPKKGRRTEPGRRLRHSLGDMDIRHLDLDRMTINELRKECAARELSGKG